MRAGFWSRVAECLLGRRRSSHAHRHSDAVLLARTEELNQNADDYWRSVGTQASGRRYALNRPFSGPTAAIDIYRLGLMMAELRLGPGLDVLDFGAGACWLSSCLNRMGCRTVAVDVSRTALELGRELFALDSRHRGDLEPRFLAYDGHSLPLPDSSMDRVACFDAFHHVPNPDELLRELCRVLRRGGRLVMAEPGEGHSHADTSAFDESAFSVLENDFDVVDIERRARAAGFDELRVKPYLDPTVKTVSAAAYAGLGRLRPGLRLAGLRAGLDVAVAIPRSFRSCAVVVLTKGAQVRDSRSPGLLRGEMTLLAPLGVLRGHCGKTIQARMRIKNIGDTLWRHERDRAGGTVLLGSHLLEAGGRPLRKEYLWAPLPCDVGPGEEAEVPVTVPVPAEAGTYGLRFDLVDEDVIWFSQAGSPPLDVVLEAMDADEDRSYRAAIHVLPDGAATRLPAGSRTRLQLRIENVGRAAWPRAERLATGAIRVGAQLLDAAGELIDLDYVRADLPRSVAPGEAGEMRLEFKLPSQPGRYLVKVDLVQEQVCWFEQRGSRPLLIECEATAEVPDSTAPGMLRAQLELLQPKAPAVRISPGEAIEVHVLARNLGDTLWRHAEGREQGHVRLGAMLVSRDGTHDYWRAPIPHDVRPDAMAEIRASMPAPATQGEYTVVLDLVDEGVAWFQDEGSPVVSFLMRVAPDLPS